jgi:hypothetical protein
MPSAFETMKAKILKAGDGNESLSQEKLEDMVYKRYTSSKITPEEYNELCCLIDGVFFG